MATDRPRFTISMDTETLKRVEDYRYSRRISTQSKAILELVVEGLKEQDIGLDTGSTSSLVEEVSKSELELLRNFRLLNDEGQYKLSDYADDLISSKKYIKSHANKLGQKQA